jgi:drug/metabolite transporter (DMT)-like permease
MHASWNALMKVASDRLISIAIINLVGTIAAAVIIPFAGFPAAESWPFLVASILIHLLYYTGLIYAYRYGDLSQVYPIARGASPLFLAVLSGPVIGEWLSPVQLGGVLLVSLGIASLALGRGSPRAVGFALLTAATIAAYSSVDALGVRLSGNPAGYIGWLFILDGLPVALFVLWRRGRSMLTVAANNLTTSIIGGLLSITGYGIVVWCYSLGPVAPISALRETSVIFAAIIGATLLGEPFGLRRVIAAAVVAGGIVLINFAR